MEPRAERARASRRQFSRRRQRTAMFPRQIQNWAPQNELHATAGHRKIILVRLTRGQVAHCSRKAVIAASAVARPMRSRYDVNQMRSLMRVPRDAEPGWIVPLFCPHARRCQRFRLRVVRCAHRAPHSFTTRFCFLCDLSAAWSRRSLSEGGSMQWFESLVFQR
jgi:hypothetical protein